MKASKVSADNKGGKTPRRQSDQGKSAVGRLGNALHGRRIGIGFRLFGAFGAVAFLTLVATGIAWLRSEEHTSELQSLMRISYAVFCLTKKNTPHYRKHRNQDYQQNSQ